MSTILYRAFALFLVGALVWYSGHQHAMRDIEKQVALAQQKTKQECQAQFVKALDEEKALKEEARKRNEQLDKTVAKLESRLKKPAIQIIETPNQEPIYESCDLDALRLDVGTVRLLNDLRAGK